MAEQKDFTTVFEHFLNRRLQKFYHEPLTKETIWKVYKLLQEDINKIFGGFQFDLTQKSKDWIIESYFKELNINGQAVALQFLSNPVDIKTLDTNDLRIMRALFAASDLGDVIDEELRRRT